MVGVGVVVEKGPGTQGVVIDVDRALKVGPECCVMVLGGKGEAFESRRIRTA